MSSLNIENCTQPFEECLDAVAEPSNQFTMILFPSIVQKFISSRYRSGFSSLRFIEEDMQMLPMSFEFQPFSPFFETMNEKIDQMLSNGLIEHYYKNFVNPKDRKPIIESIPPQVLTMDHVTIGFQVCLIPLALSFVVFILEKIFAMFSK